MPSVFELRPRALYSRLAARCTERFSELGFYRLVVGLNLSTASGLKLRDDGFRAYRRRISYVTKIVLRRTSSQ